MNGELPIPAEKLEELQAQRTATAQANATPFPGAAKNAFDVSPDITVGVYKVRPFYDGDFDILQSLNHPLAKMAFDGQSYGGSMTDMRGMNSWLLCYLFTHPIEEVDELAIKDLNQLKTNAKKEFYKMSLGGLMEINKAIFQQFSAYFSTVVGLEATEEEGSKKNP